MGTRHKIYTISGKSQLSIAEKFKIKHLLPKIASCQRNDRDVQCWGTSTAAPGLFLSGAPAWLWSAALPCRFRLWYDVTNIQQMPGYRSFAAEPKRRRVAALQRLFHNHKEPEIQIHRKIMLKEFGLCGNFRHNGGVKMLALNSPGNTLR